MIARFHFPTAGCATAFGLPIDEAVQRVLACARELNTAAEKLPEGEGFAQRLVKAVQARVTPVARPRIALANAAVAPKAEDDSFAERLKKECEKLSGRKQHKEYVERERSRYPQRRQPTKGE